MLEVTCEAVRGRMAVYAGANHIATKGAIRLARIAEEAGVDALSVLTPMFISQTQEEVEGYYRAVAESTRLPIVIYNNKPKTNVTVAPATVARLAEIPNIVGVKDSTGDMTNTEEYLRLTRGNPNFHVLIGRDTLILAGCTTARRARSPSCANIAPAVAVEIYDRFQAGDYAGALDAQFRLADLRIATNMGTFPVVIKEGLQLLGYDVGGCVAPDLPARPAGARGARADDGAHRRAEGARNQGLTRQEWEVRLWNALALSGWASWASPWRRTCSRRATR